MSERTNLWAYRIVALIVALGMWYFTVAETRKNQAQKTIAASVTYTNMPDNLAIISDKPKVNVHLAGTSREVRGLGPQDVDVLVDLAQVESGTVNVSLEKIDVLVKDDPASIRVLSIEPKVISLEFDVVEQRSVPVSAELVGEPAAGATVTRVQVIPDMVLIEGPRAYVGRIQELTIGPVSLDTHALSFTEDVPVIVPNPLVRVVRPPLVRVEVSLAQPPAPSGPE